MDANSINQVIEKLAEKAGVARDQVAPLAQQCVVEFARQQTCYAIATAVLGLVLLAATIWGAYKSWQLRDAIVKIDAELPTFGLLFMLAVAIVGAFAGSVHFAGNACAPTYELVRQFLGK